MARSFNRLHPIQSAKIEFPWSDFLIDAGTAKIEKNILTAIKNPTSDYFVEIGSSVKYFYFEFHFSAETVTNPKVVHWLLQKLEGGIAAAELDPLFYNSALRNKIIKRGMEMLPKDTSTVFKRIFVVRVPKGMQRMAEGDIWKFTYHCSSTETINSCGIVITRVYN